MYEPTQVSATECDKAVRQHLWEDPNQVFYQMTEGTNIISYVRKGALDYSSSSGTWSCREESQTNSDGNLERSVLERVHLQFEIKVINGRYNLWNRSIQLTDSIVLTTDRWSSTGAATVEGVVYLQDRPGSPLPVCNLRLIKGPLPFVILEPRSESEDFYMAINVPSRLKISYCRRNLPVPKECHRSIVKQRPVYPTN